jgi:hypothetical protein
MAHLPPFIGLNEAAYRAHRKRPLPVKTVCVRAEPGGKNQERGKATSPSRMVRNLLLSASIARENRWEPWYTGQGGA